MIERPIIFNGDMVRAILEGRKTQTRRPITKAHDVAWAGAVLPASEAGWIAWWPGTEPGLAEFTKRAYRKGFPCPFGEPGDRLWVRETWWDFGDGHVFYRANHASDPKDDMAHGVMWRPSINMPRWASRLTLEITDVRVQRLQEITAQEALADGLALVEIVNLAMYGALNSKWAAIDPPARSAFAQKWDAVYAPRGHGWDANPWVWAITFKRMEAPA